MRNVMLQVLRGTLAATPPLGDGEFYFAEDTTELFVGFAGGTFKVGNMSVQIQDSAGNSLTSLGGSLNVHVTNSPDSPVSVDNFPAVQTTTQVGGASNLVGDTQVKGVQGTVALMVQDFKDAGRVIKVFSASFTAATTEALVSLTPNADGVPGTAGTSFTVTAGKRFRIQALFLTCFNVTAAIHACQVNLRMASTGAVTVASPIIGTVGVTTPAATINEASSQAQSYPEGIELSGSMQFGISQVGIALAGQTVVLVGYEY